MGRHHLGLYDMCTGPDQADEIMNCCICVSERTEKLIRRVMQKQAFVVVIPKEGLFGTSPAKLFLNETFFSTFSLVTQHVTLRKPRIRKMSCNFVILVFSMQKRFHKILQS